MQILNRKARFNYDITEELEAGIVLEGSEVKSLRLSRANIAESYIAEKSGEIFLINSHISEYPGANRFNHLVKRPRKLLLNKKQINRISGKINKEGAVVVPLKIYSNNKGYIKVLLGIGKGKKLHDKRQSIKEREEKRRMQRNQE
jgi:SsrA-binding protein